MNRRRGSMAAFVRLWRRLDGLERRLPVDRLEVHAGHGVADDRGRGHRV